jgi:hypothetical protein
VNQNPREAGRSSYPETIVYLRACFDESIRADFDEAICVGGYLFKVAAYERFKRQWHRTVLRHGDRRFTAFHMTDLFAGKKEYDGLRTPDRVAVLDAAIEAVCAHAYAGIGTYFDQAEFERSVEPDWAQNYGSIYSLACQLCLQATGHWLREWKCPMRVDYLFERGHKHWKEADKRLAAVTKLPDISKTFRYRSHAFVDKGEPGLQTADLFAWTMTRVHAHAAGKPIYPDFVPVLIKLANAPTRQKLHKVTGDKLKRLLHEHATVPHDLFVDFKHKGTLK